MKRVFKVVVFLIFLIIGLFAAGAGFVGVMDADAYRPELAEMLGKKIGREVKLNGPIAFSVGLRGIKISAEDASLANPSGASRPFLARVGKLELGIDAKPLLDRRLSINELSIENADILLETNQAGKNNWDLGGAAIPPSSAKSKKVSSRSAALSIDNLTIANSQIAFLDKEGKRLGANILSLSLEGRGAGTEVAFKGDINGGVFAANIKTDLSDLLSLRPFSADIVAAYDVLKFAARGRIDPTSKKAEFSDYEVSAGNTKIAGAFEATWSGAKPTLRGTLISDRIDPADFKLGVLTMGGGESNAAAEIKADSKRFFSTIPLPVDMLKSVDAALSVSVGAYPVNKGVLEKIKAKLVLVNGNLVLDPVKAYVGKAVVDVRVALNASKNPARLDLGMIAKDVDLGDLQHLGGMASFMEGKASADAQLTGEGGTPHEIASTFGGVINVTAGKGEIFTGAAAGISTVLAAIFGVGSDDSALNCLAARFIVKGGVLTDNGLLIDSAASTVSGKGQVNLGSEKIAMSLHARSKLVDIGGLIPSVYIGGTLKDPSYSVNASGVLKNIVSTLMQGNPDIISSQVPEIQTPPAGQNACVYTLEHPLKETAAPAAVLTDPINKAAGAINSLVKGLLRQ